MTNALSWPYFLAKRDAIKESKWDVKHSAQEKWRAFKGGKKELWGIAAAVAQNEKLSKNLRASRNICFLLPGCRVEYK